MDRDVFISYASAQQELATALCERLEDTGLLCSIAPRDIPSGVDYPSGILQAVRRSRCFVLVFSANTMESPHVLREVELAVSARIPIVTLRVQLVSPQGSFEYLLSPVQWLDAFKDIDQGVEATVVAVQQLLQNSLSPTGTTAARFLRFLERLNVAPDGALLEAEILERIVDMSSLQEMLGPNFDRTVLEEHFSALESEMRQAGLSVLNLRERFWQTGRLPLISQSDLDLVRHLTRDATFPAVEAADALVGGGYYYALVRLARVFDKAGLASYSDREMVEELTLKSVNSGLLRPTRPLNLEKGPHDYTSSFQVTDRARRLSNLLDRWARLEHDGPRASAVQQQHAADSAPRRS